MPPQIGQQDPALSFSTSKLATLEQNFLRILGCDLGKMQEGISHCGGDHEGDRSLAEAQM